MERKQNDVSGNQTGKLCRKIIFGILWRYKNVIYTERTYLKLLERKAKREEVRQQETGSQVPVNLIVILLYFSMMMLVLLYVKYFRTDCHVYFGLLKGSKSRGNGHGVHVAIVTILNDVQHKDAVVIKRKLLKDMMHEDLKSEREEQGTNTLMLSLESLSLLTTRLTKS